MFHRTPLTIVQQPTALVRRQSVFGFFFGDMQLQQDVDDTIVAGGLFLYLTQKANGVHCLNHRYVWGDILHFVRLQMAYEMPLYVIGQGFMFGRKLPLMTFSKDALTFIIGVHDIVGRMILADSHQSRC